MLCGERQMQSMTSCARLDVLVGQPTGGDSGGSSFVIIGCVSVSVLLYYS